MCVGLRERLHVRVGARACTREAAHVCVCARARVWAKTAVSSYLN